MDYRDQLLSLVDTYGARVNLSRARLGTIIMNQGRFFIALLPNAEGKRRAVSVDNFLKVKRWFRDHWPDDHPWPPSVDLWGLDDPAPDAAAPPATCKPGLQVAGPVSASGPPDPTFEQTSIVAGSAAA